MSERYLTWNPARRQAWVEHDAWPAKAIKYWQDGLDGTRKYPRSTASFGVYRACRDMCHLYLIEERDWHDYAPGP